MDNMYTLPRIQTWISALLQAGLALAASLGKILRFLGLSGANKVTVIGYAFLGLSMLLFIIKRFSGAI